MARKERFYLRNPGVVLVGAGPASIVVARGAAPVLLESVAGANLSALVRAAIEPVTAAALRPHADARTLAALVAQRVLLEGDSRDALLAVRGVAPAAAVGKKPCRHLVLGVTGAVNAVHTFAIASHLGDYFCDRLDIILTRAARRIVRADAYRYLGFQTWTSAFAPRGDDNVPHIRLASADLVAILPASAATLHKLASGACTDLLSLVVAATRAPVVVAPSMNVAMWDHAAVAANVRLLRERGVYVIEPTVGTEVSEKQEATWQLGSMPIDPQLIARSLGAVLAAHTAAAPVTDRRDRRGGRPRAARRA
jgi:phosphopantothenoylcysteine decarboxylase/phosphopantothenate--cysteine ligase